MRSSIRDIFVSRGTRRAALVITVVLPVLLAAYAWFMNHRACSSCEGGMDLAGYIDPEFGSAFVLRISVRIGVAVLSGL